MDEKKPKSVQQIEDEQLDEVSGGKRLTQKDALSLSRRRSSAKLPGVHPIPVPKTQSLRVAGECLSVAVDDSDEGTDQSLY